jgi:serine/threonine protein kinase
MLMHNEYVLLEILKGCPGVEQAHGLLVDYVHDEKSKTPAKAKKRITLVLDPCSDKSCENWMNINQVNYNISLQEYISRHKMSEREALMIFYEIVKVVERIHSVGVIHRDLKLQNFLINLQTRRVTLINFCLGKVLSSDDQMLVDQRGSPAYISPEILKGAYRGKPTDVWTLGVILYILIYSNFPFVENTTGALFNKISQCELVLPTDIRVSEATKKLIKNHLLTASVDRFTATEIREYLERQFDRINRASAISTASLQKDDQVVPDIDNQPPKLICQDPPSPKFDLSTENISIILKMISPSTQHEQNKMFLKPSLLAERCNRISVSPSNSPSGNVGVTRNLTRQINNLALRNRQNNSNSGLSWHNRISNSSLYEVRFRSAESTILADRVRMQQRAASTSNVVSSFESIYNTLNELFSAGSFPANAIIHEFQGNINQDISLKLSIWLRTNFHENPLVREIYQTAGNSPGSDVEKFVEFLRRCHVEMEMINGQVFVKAQQTNQILIFMTYLLQLAGYNNNYFINISRGS